MTVQPLWIASAASWMSTPGVPAGCTSGGPNMGWDMLHHGIHLNGLPADSPSSSSSSVQAVWGMAVSSSQQAPHQIWSSLVSVPALTSQRRSSRGQYRWLTFLQAQPQPCS